MKKKKIDKFLDRLLQDYSKQVSLEQGLFLKNEPNRLKVRGLSNGGGFGGIPNDMGEFDMGMEEEPTSEGPMGEIDLSELGEPDEIGTPNQEMEAEMETL